MIRQLTLTATLLIATNLAFGQEAGPGNRAWNVELGGLGQLISFNLEWGIGSKGKWILGCTRGRG